MDEPIEYKYYRTGGHIYRFHIEPDTDPWNPRMDMDGNIGTMFCMHRVYTLGDKTDYVDAAGMKLEMIKELGINMNKIRRYLKTNGQIDIKYNRSNKEWQIWGMSYSPTKRITSYDVIDSAKEFDDLKNTIIEYLTVEDLESISNGKLIFLPLYLLDHSGISIRTSDFCDPWDSGQVGVIWTTLERARNTYGWSRKSKPSELNEWILEYLQDEVTRYDDYLRDNCWGYVEEILLPDGTWEESESCWGYYCNSNDPLNEIALSVCGKEIVLHEMPTSA